MDKEAFIGKLSRIRDRVDCGEDFWSAVHAEKFSSYASAWTIKPMVSISVWIEKNGGRRAALAMLDKSIESAKRRRAFVTREATP
jgi:hypothetical protein